MIPKPHRYYQTGQPYSFSSNQSYFTTKFTQVGATMEIYEQEVIIYDGGSVEGWEDEETNEEI